MTIEYTPKGVCSYKMEIDVADGLVQDVRIFGGCNGNGKGIAALVRGMKISDVIDRLSGIRCGGKSSSCPAQLAQALRTVANDSAD